MSISQTETKVKTPPNDRAASIANSMVIEGHVLAAAVLSQAIDAFQTELDRGEFDQRQSDAVAFCRATERGRV